LLLALTLVEVGLAGSVSEAADADAVAVLVALALEIKLSAISGDIVAVVV